MRLCAISDTHLYSPTIPECDVLIHAGDICNRGTMSEFVSEVKWLSRQSAKHVVLVPGNHDKYVQAFQGDAKKLCDDYNIHLLIDAWTTVEGLSIYGSPWTPEFCNWAFNHDERAAMRRWEGLEYTDVLVTHGPPQGILDRAHGVDLGCPHLWEAVKRTQPALHLFGHIHEGHGSRTCSWVDTSKTTVFANVAILDGRYQPYDDSVFELEFS